MIFNFITDINSVSEMQLAVMSYNLGLLFFIFEVAKFIVGFIHNKFDKRRVN